METSVKITLIIVATILLLALAGIGIYLQSQSGEEVTVNGIAEVKAEPDIISVYFNVETNGSTAKKAKDSNAEIVDEVIIGMVKLGLERKDIQTENFNVRQDYGWVDGERVNKGYRATHRIKVELDSDKKELVGNVIDEGVDSGSEISYINFELSRDRQNELKRKALREATEDGRSKAEGIASGLGKSLGDVVSIRSQEFSYNPWRMYGGKAANVESAKEALTNIQPGEKTVSGRVEVVYEIK